ncbi:glutamate-rich protein 2 [Culicoides brevitarsis]|uniref:glutamate-rich protein 2 n=1 Tax=Culicoides brevitarsis TaxID=469753 RepID=UPI00307B7EFF
MYSNKSSYKTLDLPNELSLQNFEPHRARNDEKMIAPMELLAQFLSTVMQKDYENALVFCKLIQQFEPTNATANRFYPVIIKKLKSKPVPGMDSSSDEDEDDFLDNDENDDAGNDDSGIDKEDSDESDSDEEEIEIPPKAPTKKALNNLEKQKEIVKHLRSKVVHKNP